MSPLTSGAFSMNTACEAPGHDGELSVRQHLVLRDDAEPPPGQDPRSDGLQAVDIQAASAGGGEPLLRHLRRKAYDHHRGDRPTQLEWDHGQDHRRSPRGDATVPKESGRGEILWPAGCEVTRDNGAEHFMLTETPTVQMILETNLARGDT